MKSLFYVSRFSHPLSSQDIDSIHRTAERNNKKNGITGFLVCLGDMFFQLLEGKARDVDRLFLEKIRHDERHRDVRCLKTDLKVTRRMFPNWHMQVFDLNEAEETLPHAFRLMFTSLVESTYILAQYTEPAVSRMLELGIDPTQAKARKRKATVLFSDIIGFSQLSEWLKPADLLDLVNIHIEICTQSISQFEGIVNKLLGDGILAYFPQAETDPALDASLQILQNMKQTRRKASKSSALKHLYSGVGLANGTVYEGNIGVALKRDYTILGNPVNMAARLESLTRELECPLILSHSVVSRAQRQWNIGSLGRHRLKGRSRPNEIYTLSDLPPLDIEGIYGDITKTFSRGRRKCP